jgi:hypothetical protein
MKYRLSLFLLGLLAILFPCSLSDRVSQDIAVSR